MSSYNKWLQKVLPVVQELPKDSNSSASGIPLITPTDTCNRSVSAMAPVRNRPASSNRRVQPAQDKSPVAVAGVGTHHSPSCFCGCRAVAGYTHEHGLK